MDVDSCEIHNLEEGVAQFGISTGDDRWGIYGSSQQMETGISPHRDSIECAVKFNATRRPLRHKKELEGVPEMVQYAYDRRAISIAPLTSPLNDTHLLKSEIPRSVIFPLFMRDCPVPCDILNQAGEVVLSAQTIFSDPSMTLDPAGALEATPYVISAHITESLLGFHPDCQPGAIVELCAGFGGNSVEFLKSPHCTKLVAVELDPQRCSMWRSNVAKLPFEKASKASLVEGDCLGWLQGGGLGRDVQGRLGGVFISPPWGGVAHKGSGWYSVTDPGFDLVGVCKAAWGGMLAHGGVVEEEREAADLKEEGRRRQVKVRKVSACRLSVYLPRHVSVEELVWFADQLGGVGGIEVDRVMMRGPYQRVIHPVFSHKVTLVNFVPRDIITCTETQQVLHESDLTFDLSSAPTFTPTPAAGPRAAPLQINPHAGWLQECSRRLLSSKRTKVEDRAMADLLSGPTVRPDQRPLLATRTGEATDSAPAVWFDQTLLDGVARRLRPSRLPRLRARREVERLLHAVKQGGSVSLPTARQMGAFEENKLAGDATRDESVCDIECDAHANVSNSSTISQQVLSNSTLFEFAFALAACEWLNESPSDQLASLRRVVELLGVSRLCMLLEKTDELDALRAALPSHPSLQDPPPTDRDTRGLLAVPPGTRTRGGIFFALLKANHRPVYNKLESDRRRAKELLANSHHHKRNHPAPSQHQGGKRPHPDPGAPRHGAGSKKRPQLTDRRLAPHVPSVMPERQDRLPPGGFPRGPDGSVLRDVRGDLDD